MPGVPPSSTPSTKYYKDDGPGDAPPPNLDAIADAVPRLEPLHRFANRPYTVLGQDYVPATTLRPYKERGIASWYGRKFHGQKTSIGETYDMYGMTAAHPTLPLPSYARVTNVATGKSVIVRVNDRGPFLHSRVIDLSYAAAYKVGIAGKGSGEVEVEAIVPAGGGTLVAAAPPPVVAPAPAAGPLPPPVAATAPPPGADMRAARADQRRSERRLRGPAGRVPELRECAEFPRARAVAARRRAGRAEGAGDGRPLSGLCRALSQSRRGEARGRPHHRRVRLCHGGRAALSTGNLDAARTVNPLQAVCSL